MKAPTPVNPWIKARKAGVPVVAIESADPAATIVKCQQALNGKHSATPILVHDIIRGTRSENEPGAQVLSHFTDDGLGTDPVGWLAAFVAKRDKLQVVIPGEDGEEPRKIGAVIFMVHANRFIEEVGYLQAVWNCRLAFEPLGVTLVLLGPSFKLPAELKNDVVLISEPLPDHAELDGILGSLADDASLTGDKIGDRETVVDTMTGTSAFGARQILAMSITKDGIDRDQLWERKRKMIEQTPGLSVWRGGSRFEDLGGLENLKDFLRRVLTSGTTPCRAVGFLDEIEKSVAGAAGDLSGTSQDQMAVVLKVMQDYAIPGLILVGHGGTGKSEIAKGAGNVAGCPVISIDLGAMKDSLVGGSEVRVRQAFDVFRAVSQGKGLFIATCNKITSLPPELRRRFTLGTFFVDLPSADEQSLIWPIWIKRFELTAKQSKPLPDCDGWTGAEIRACCDVAFRTGLTLREAAAYVVPVVKSAPEQVEALRKLASNRFISASKPGVYVYRAADENKTATSGRRIET